MLIAITRNVSDRIAYCELTHLKRRPIDVSLARTQHRSYEQCLTELGCEVQTLPPEPDLPDSVFVEDTAVVLDELAIILRSGVESRRAETDSIARALSSYRQLFHITDPGTVDGGDVLRVDKTVYVGMSGRSNKAGAEQMRQFLKPYGYDVRNAPVKGCLHLKSAVTQIAEQTLLINRNWVDSENFSANKFIDIDPSEPYAANALWVNGTVIYPSLFPRTQRKLEEAGIKQRIVDVSELAKAEGALTCCSLIFER
ncbi:dimethylargininase [bacterium]|nr:MAG: dimethylargininase [bacterium]